MERAKRPLPEDQEDMLSPARALRESASESGSQRIGNNGPVANPEVSFPDAGNEDDADEGAAAAGV